MTLRLLVSGVLISLNAFALPQNAKVVGAATYKQMELRQLAHPSILWVD